MDKLKSTCRITEVDDTSDMLLKIYGESQAVSDDKFLQSIFADMKPLSDQITSAIKQDKAQSTLDEADVVRDNAVVALSNLLTGCSTMPVEKLAKSGIALKTVFDKYGVKITRESYVNESSLIESLLKDLDDQSLKSDIAALQGVGETIEALRSAQDAFNRARLDYEAAKAENSVAVSATELKKPILALINDKLVPYLNIMVIAEPDKFSVFAGRVSETIDRANASVASRSKKSE